MEVTVRHRLVKQCFLIISQYAKLLICLMSVTLPVCVLAWWLCAGKVEVESAAAAAAVAAAAAAAVVAAAVVVAAAAAVAAAAGQGGQRERERGGDERSIVNVIECFF